MTLEEAIKHAEEVAEENQRVVDTKDVTIDMLFCDDEEIKERLTNYKRCAEEHRQLAEWLKDYKRLLEQQSREDCISRQAAIDALTKTSGIRGDTLKALYDLPSVNPRPKTGHWIGHREHCENLGVMPSGLGAYEWCSNCDCGIDVREWHRNNYNYCPNCGCRMVEPQESEEV